MVNYRAGRSSCVFKRPWISGVVFPANKRSATIIHRHTWQSLGIQRRGFWLYSFWHCGFTDFTATNVACSGESDTATGGNVKQKRDCVSTAVVWVPNLGDETFKLWHRAEKWGSQKPKALVENVGQYRRKEQGYCEKGNVREELMRQCSKEGEHL